MRKIRDILEPYRGFIETYILVGINLLIALVIIIIFVFVYMRVV